MKREFNNEPRNNMRVLQLIDSLRSGGAEKMSITYANVLAKRIDASFLCCTRIEGLMKSQLSPDVGYLFLNKKNTLDLQAFLKLRIFVKRNKIDLIQAHGSSWFLALMLKLSLPGTKLVWHDHWGERALKNKAPGILAPASQFFDGVITVNKELKDWAVKNLKSKKVHFFPNFLTDTKNKGSMACSLLGDNSFKIIHLANLKPVKDHLNLLRAFEMVQKTHSEISLHLIGKYENDFYSNEISNFIQKKSLSQKVFMYGEQDNVADLLRSANMGILASRSEGLPMALLEYGRAGIPVVCTRVGQCEEILDGHGIVVPSQNYLELSRAINSYFENPTFHERHAIAFQKKVLLEFSEEAVFGGILNFLKNLTSKGGVVKK